MPIICRFFPDPLSDRYRPNTENGNFGISNIICWQFCYNSTSDPKLGERVHSPWDLYLQYPQHDRSNVRGKKQLFQTWLWKANETINGPSFLAKLFDWSLLCAIWHLTSWGQGSEDQMKIWRFNGVVTSSNTLKIILMPNLVCRWTVVRTWTSKTFTGIG